MKSWEKASEIFLRDWKHVLEGVEEDEKDGKCEADKRK